MTRSVVFDILFFPLEVRKAGVSFETAHHARSPWMSKWIPKKSGADEI